MKEKATIRESRTHQDDHNCLWQEYSQYQILNRNYMYLRSGCYFVEYPTNQMHCFLGTICCHTLQPCTLRRFFFYCIDEYIFKCGQQLALDCMRQKPLKRRHVLFPLPHVGRLSARFTVFCRPNGPGRHTDR